MLGASSTRRLRMRELTIRAQQPAAPTAAVAASFLEKEPHGRPVSVSISWQMKYQRPWPETMACLAGWRRYGRWWWWCKGVRGAKTGFQPLQLSRLSLLVLRLTPGSAAHVCVCVYVHAPRAPRDSVRRFSVLSSVWKNRPRHKTQVEQC